VLGYSYWHRSLNPKKLVEVGFSRLPPRITMSMNIKLLKLKDTTSVPRIRPLSAADVPAACTLLNGYLSKFGLVPVFSQVRQLPFLLHIIFMMFFDFINPPTNICRL
jgi:hypothetical protein